MDCGLKTLLQDVLEVEKSIDKLVLKLQSLSGIQSMDPDILADMAVVTDSIDSFLISRDLLSETRGLIQSSVVVMR